MAYVEWDGKGADRVVVARGDKGATPGKPIVLDDGGWDHYWPAVACAGEKALVVWSSHEKGNVDLHFAHRDWQSLAGAYAMCNTTWGALMHRLKAVAEGEEPGPLFQA